MKPIYKILIAVGITGAIGFGFWYFSKPKETKPEPKPNPEPKPDNTTQSNVSGEKPDFVIQDSAPVIKSKSVYAVCSDRAYQILRDEKTGGVHLGNLAYQFKGNTKLGEFVKDVFIKYSMPYVIVKDAKGNEVLVNKTHTRIQLD